MTIIKTKDLDGIALDWAVATIDLKNEGLTFTVRDGIGVGVDMTEEGGLICIFLPGPNLMRATKARRKLQADHATAYRPSTDPAQGHPLMERERISAQFADGPGTFIGEPQSGPRWLCRAPGRSVNEVGPTMLIAGMRAFVAAKLGEEVDVPQELLP